MKAISYSPAQFQSCMLPTQKLKWVLLARRCPVVQLLAALASLQRVRRWKVPDEVDKFSDRCVFGFVLFYSVMANRGECNRNFSGSCRSVRAEGGQPAGWTRNKFSLGEVKVSAVEKYLCARTAEAFEIWQERTEAEPQWTCSVRVLGFASVSCCGSSTPSNERCMCSLMYVSYLVLL